MRDGKQWPIGIAVATIGLVIVSIITIYIALMQPVKENDDMMLDYHTLDSNVNDIIVAQIKFDRKYVITYVGDALRMQGSTLAYHIEDLNGNPVNDAKMTVVLSRPIVDEKLELRSAHVKEGTYYFENITPPKEGRWNILAKVMIDGDYRHFNLKADTKDPHLYEYGLDKPTRDFTANGPKTH